MHIERYRRSRYFGVYADDGVLICLTVYKKGAQEVLRRLQALAPDAEGRGAVIPQPAPETRLTAATRRRWRRALAIAAILFEEEGYHGRYLKAISQHLAQQPVNGATPKRKDTGQYCSRCEAWRPETKAGTCTTCGTELVPF
jgi:hypothetical protein